MAEIQSSNGDQEIQEKPVDSLTSDIKMKTKDEDINLSEVQTNNGLVEKDEKEKKEVQASDNVAEEKPSSECTEAQKDESTKAEIVNEAGAPSTNKEEKTNGKVEEKTEEQAQKKESLGATVAKHYNEIPAGSKEARTESKIFYLRSFNNWVKSVMINEYLEKVKRRKRTSDVVNVLDLACGKGGDLLKWQKGKADHVIMTDIAATSIEQCKDRYNKMEKETRHKHHRDRLFTVECFAADCTKEIISEKFKRKDIKLDMTSCQFAYHYSFESYEQADLMLKNACANLRVGGYFIGTTPDSNKLVKRIKTMEGDSFGNSVYNIKPDNKEDFSLFGVKYMFHLEGVVDCPEFLVCFPAFEKIASRYNMKLIYKKNFHDVFKEHERSYSSLLQKMNALEPYPPAADKTTSATVEKQYKAAADFLEKKTTVKQVRTLSADEWEAAGIYLAFVFEKVEPPREGRTSEREDRKRHRDRSHDSNKSSGRSHSHGSSHDKRRSSGSSSAKRSKKDSEAEEVYEVKDEIEGDEEPEKMEEVTTPATQDTSAAKEAASDQQLPSASEASSIEPKLSSETSPAKEVISSNENNTASTGVSSTNEVVGTEHAGEAEEKIEQAVEATEEKIEQAVEATEENSE